MIEKKYTDACALLVEWGHWNRTDIKLGYPSSSAHVKALEGGGGTSIGIDEPPHIRVLNEILRDLRSEHPLRYRAISLTYIGNTPEYKLGSRMRISRDKAKRFLDRGIGYVEGRL